MLTFLNQPCAGVSTSDLPLWPMLEVMILAGSWFILYLHPSLRQVQCNIPWSVLNLALSFCHMQPQHREQTSVCSCALFSSFAEHKASAVSLMRARSVHFHPLLPPVGMMIDSVSGSRWLTPPTQPPTLLPSLYQHVSPYCCLSFPLHRSSSARLHLFPTYKHRLSFPGILIMSYSL